MTQKVKFASTAIDVGKSIKEISYLLRDAGADRFATLQDLERGRVGVQFFLRGQGIELMIDCAAIEERLETTADRKSKKGPEAAERVAFRLLLNWLANNFELVRWGVFDVMEAFLPYMVLPTGQTVREVLIQMTPEGTKRLALPAAAVAKPDAAP